MKLAIRCRHCGTRRTWEKLENDVLEPAPSPSGSRDPYGCTASPTGFCEPREIESRGDRMTRELAESARSRRASRMGSGTFRKSR